MKTLLKLACIAFLMLYPAAAFSQASGISQVNIIIAPAQSIQVQHPTVNIQMTQASHYAAGSSSGQQANHVRVTSTTGYQVTVKSQTQFFALNGNATTLPVNTIAVQTTLGSDLSGSNSAPPSGLVITPQVMLTTPGNTIISTPTGEANRGFHVNYTIPANQASNYLNRDAGTYNTTVTYSLMPL